MSVFQTINNVAADAHGFRVTLNIISQSTNCPPDLKAVVETLRDDHNWNRHKLSKVEMESIYAHLDSEVCGHALGEWNVESHRMRDWGFPFWRSDHTEWWDGEHRAVDCQLCGHRDNRYEFPLVNLKTGEEIWTGSTCIVKYGVTVDGDACAETALKKLNSMKKKSKTAQTKDAWEKAYPDADVVIERLCRATSHRREAVCALRRSEGCGRRWNSDLAIPRESAEALADIHPSRREIPRQERVSVPTAYGSSLGYRWQG